MTYALDLLTNILKTLVSGGKAILNNVLQAVLKAVHEGSAAAVKTLQAQLRIVSA